MRQEISNFPPAPEKSKRTAQDSPWQKIALGISTVIFFAMVLSFAIKIEEAMPENATVLVDLNSDLYTSRSCLIDGTTEPSLLENRVGNKRGQTAYVLKAGVLEAPLHAVGNARPDRVCESAGGFRAERSLFSFLLGINSRWTESGDWRW